MWALLALWSTRAAGQGGAVVRTLAEPALGTVPRVLPLADGGWAMFSPDSLRLARFSACGAPVWARQIVVGDNRYIPGLHDAIVTADGGFALLTVVEAADGRLLCLLIRFDGQGDFLWTRLVGAPGYHHYPYSLLETATGNLLLYGNAAHVSSAPLYNFLTCLDRTGSVRWARFYSLGGIWGGAVLTRDGGLLLRTGDRFIRTDSLGAVAWCSRVFGAPSVSYLAPAETPGGFVVSFGETGAQPISFVRLDSQGRLLGGGRGRATFAGRPPRLRPRPGGGLVGVVNATTGAGPRPLLLEWNDSMRLVRQRLLTAGPSFFATDAAPTATGGAVLVGRSGAGEVFYATATADLRLACDSLPPATGTSAETIGQDFISVAVSQAPFLTTSHPLSIRRVQPLRPATICAVLPALVLGPDTAICDGTTLRLADRRAAGFDEYLWSTGATTPTLPVRQPGTYWLRAITNCGLDTLRDTIAVAVVAVPAPPPAPDTLLCTETPSVALDATVAGPATYRWLDGPTSPRRLVTAAGIYEIDIAVGACVRRVRYRVGTCERLTMPNVFTPFAPDGRNDRFRAIEQFGIAAATLEVYSRWGRPVFSTDDPAGVGWDGTLGGGRRAAPGVYHWLVRYRTARGEPKTLRGWVELAGP